ncbi:MAG: response regulator transcription factor [Treponema sp.]|nr:response regulator transcription factor [Treponema sp.]
MDTLWIVEDDDSIRELLVYALTQAGFAVAGYADGALFYAALHDALRTAETPDLVLLDVMLPGEDGMSLLKRLKAHEKTARIPVIMLTARGAEYDRVKGLDAGADDYITKPFSVIESIARIRAVLRRTASKTSDPPAELTACGIVLSPDKRTVRVNETPVPLTYTEFELLYYLMRKKNIVLTREIILNRIWGSDYLGDSRTVDMHIKSLRQKLGAAGGAITGGVIKTVRNVGYKLEE